MIRLILKKIHLIFHGVSAGIKASNVIRLILKKNHLIFHGVLAGIKASNMVRLILKKKSFNISCGLSGYQGVQHDASNTEKIII